MISDTGSSWLRSSLGKKTLMALSGLVLVGFVIMHLAGNLLVFAGPEALNAYAQKLRHFPALLWSARLALLASVVVHIVTSIQLARENAAARPQRYAVYRTSEATLSSRTMMLSGLLLLAYVVYHLLHFTFRTAHPQLSRAVDSLGRHDVYAMVVSSFRQPSISLVYVAAMWLLCLHLAHGIASAFQTLGLTNERTLPILTVLGRLLAVALFLGYSAIPFAILCGMVK